MTASIWNSALNILARREHSRYELVQKLNRKFPEQPDEVEQILDRLLENGLQSDERFVDSWISMQISKGRGPVRIRYESRLKGVTEAVDNALNCSDVDWYELALSVLSRKFSSGITKEEKAKAYRYLGSRGFESDSIKHALNELSAEKFES